MGLLDAMGEPVGIEVNLGMLAVPAPAVLTAERVTMTGVDETVAFEGHGEYTMVVLLKKVLDARAFWY